MASTAPLHQIRFPIDERTAADIDDNFIALFGRSFGFEDLGDGGILAPVHGGTGLGTYVIGDILVATAADTLGVITAVQKGSVLISQGAAVEPIWSTTGAGGFVLTSQGAGFDPIWATATHNLLSTTHPDTTAGAVVRGDVITGQGASATWARLGVGATGYFLRSFGASADLAWSNDGFLLTNIPESAINDDNLLARIAGTEIITGLWRYTQGVSIGLAASADQFQVTLSKSGDYLSVLKNTAGANNYGLRIIAGSSSANNALAIDDAALANNLLTLRGDGALSWGGGTFIASSTLVVGVHELLSAVHTDTVTASVVRGDVIVGNSTPKWARLAIGTAGKMLRTDGTDASWSTDGSALTALNASALASGTVALARISGLTVSQFASPNVSQWTNDAGYLTSVTAHNLLSATHGDTLAASVVRGDVVVGNATPKWSRLAIGAAGTFLRSDGTDASWGVDGSALTTLNASNLASGTVPLARIAALTVTQFASPNISQWTNNVPYLTAVTAHNLLSATHGDTVAASPVRGDLVAGNSTPAWTKLAVGAAGTVLIGGTDPSYSASPSLTGLTLTGLTAGSVVFAGVAGVLSQNNAMFFWDAANSRLGINTATPIAPLDVTGTGNLVNFARYNNAAGGVNFLCKRARGTLTVPLDLIAADNIGSFTFQTWNAGSATYRNSAIIIGEVESAPTATNTPTLMDFETATGAAAGTTFAMRITSTQRIGIGTGTPLTVLDVGLPTGGAVTISRRDSSVASGDLIGRLDFSTFGETLLTTQFVVASIQAYASQAITGDVCAGRMIFYTTGTTVAGSPVEVFRIGPNQRMSLGTLADASAILEIKAGTATANTAPLKFTSGTLLTAAEAGAIEFLTDDVYATITTGAARKPIVLADAALTTGRVPFTTTNGRLTDSANLAWSGSLLTVTSGDISIATLGKTLLLKEGSNAKMGTATLVAGTVVVLTTAVTANSRIHLTGQNASGTHGELGISARTAATSFTITSVSALDTRSVAWILFEPA